MRGPSTDSGSGFPNSRTILSRSFSSSCCRIISSKAWNCSCSACCCFIRATRVFSSSSCCCKTKVCANYSSSSCCKEEHAQGQEQRGGHWPRAEHEASADPQPFPGYPQRVSKRSPANSIFRKQTSACRAQIQSQLDQGQENHGFTLPLPWNYNPRLISLYLVSKVTLIQSKADCRGVRGVYFAHTTPDPCPH